DRERVAAAGRGRARQAEDREGRGRLLGRRVEVTLDAAVAAGRLPRGAVREAEDGRRRGRDGGPGDPAGEGGAAAAAHDVGTSARPSVSSSVPNQIAPDGS